MMPRLADPRYRLTIWRAGQRSQLAFEDRASGESFARETTADQSIGPVCAALVDLWDGGAILDTWGNPSACR